MTHMLTFVAADPAFIHLKAFNLPTQPENLDVLGKRVVEVS